MTQIEKMLSRVLRGTSDRNTSFNDLCSLLRDLGFGERIKGDHHIFYREGIPDILNLQPKQGMAKPYQVKQVRQAILKYHLGGNSDD